MSGGRMIKNFLQGMKGHMVEIYGMSDTTTTTRLVDYNDTQVLIDSTDGSHAIMFTNNIIRIDLMDEKGNYAKIPGV
jgi:hypothetical protein